MKMNGYQVTSDAESDNTIMNNVHRISQSHSNQRNQNNNQNISTQNFQNFQIFNQQNTAAKTLITLSQFSCKGEQQIQKKKIKKSSMKFKKSSKLLIEKISKNSLLNKIVEDEILNLFDF